MLLQFMWQKNFLLSKTYSRKLCGFLLMFLTSFASFSVLLLFPLYWSLYTCFWPCFINIDGVLSINSSANTFVFEDFNVHHKDWLTYSGGTDRLGELCHKWSYSKSRLSYLDPWMWLIQSCSFGFLSFFWHWYLLYNCFPSIRKFWSCCCLSFH